MEKILIIAIGNDHAGIELKFELIKFLSDKGIETIDLGPGYNEKADYPDIAEKVCNDVTSGNSELGILVCGTGVGMSISANKIKGIRAAAVSDVYSAAMSKKHNNANVLCIGQRVVGFGLAKMIVEAWINETFDGGRHQDRVDLISNLDNKYRN